MLEFDWVTILWEIVNFAIIAVALYFLVFKPIVKRSEQRAQEKARLLEEMKADREAAALKLEEINRRLANLDKELQQVADEAYEQNKVLQAELLEATQDEASQILQDALLEVRKEQFVDMKQHQNELINIILKISSQSLQKVTPPNVHAALIEELTKQIWNLGKTHMNQVQTIRESLSDRQAKAYVTSAIPLTGEQEVSLVRTFSALADNNINLEVEIDKSLIAGVKVRLGDLIIENSLAATLEAVRDEIAESLEHVNLEQND